MFKQFLSGVYIRRCLPQFSIEIHNNLKLLYYFLVFNFFITFNDWLDKGYLSKESVDTFGAVCPPYFQKCLSLHVFTVMPHGYGLAILYATLGVLLFFSLYYSLQNKWDKALSCLLVPLIFKILMVYFLAYYVQGNFHVIEIIAVIILLFGKNKIFSLKVLLSILYIFSAFIKIYPSYLLGRFFDTLVTGLPLLPTSYNYMYPTLVIVFFITASVLIWNTNVVIRKVTYLLLFLFHIYTILLVGFRFPSISIIILMVVFMSDFESFSIKKLIQEKVLSFVVLFLLVAQIIPFFITGDTHITGEGERYGFYIFNTNKQCVLEKTYSYRNGSSSVVKKESRQALYRCDPYEPWFVSQQECRTSDIQKIKFTFSVSLNGSSYFKVVDEEDICLIRSYKPFSHNTWIKEGVINKTLKVYKNTI